MEGKVVGGVGKEAERGGTKGAKLEMIGLDGQGVNEKRLGEEGGTQKRGEGGQTGR